MVDEYLTLHEKYYKADIINNIFEIVLFIKMILASSNEFDYLLFALSLNAIAGFISKIFKNKYKNIVVDIDKNLFFIENEDIINFTISDINISDFDVSKNTKRLLTENNYININNIENISIDDLKVFVEQYNQNIRKLY